MRLRIYLSIIACFFSYLGLFAADIVYLNNGNVIEGKILKEEKTNLSIKTTSGDILEYKMIEIRNIEKDATIIAPEASKKAKYTDFSTQEKGWYCGVDFSGAATVSRTIPVMGDLELSFTNGYRFNEYIKVGLGVGIRTYLGADSPEQRDSDLEGNWVIPLFANVRGDFLPQGQRMFTPYWSVDAGYAFGDGFFYAPTVGVKFGGIRNSFLLGITYMGQMMDKTPSGDSSSSSFYTNFLCARIGYEF